MRNSPLIGNALLALLIFIGVEAMLFAGLISAFLIFRAGPEWPPAALAGLRLGTPLTLANTAGLLASGVTMHLALRAIRRGKPSFVRWLLATLALGLAFLAIQGSEWARLIAHGLTLQTGAYGGIFYLLIGLHALHVLGGFTWLCVIALRARQAHEGVLLCAVYWTFVVALWPALFALVYAPWNS